MRQAFCNGLVQQALLPEFVFLTGDLGFKALEPLRDALGPRFINAGVSEQNMVSVAAGLRAVVCGRGLTASLPSSMHALLNRSAMTSVSMTFPSSWSGTAAVTDTA